ncbi:hypothetical protein [uncultured Paludibaculum sp.]|uniref:hypothetical protein n=1 Tax=uncultured Paludibaculum sp. TaxID=1765020 RepID=UPI002AAAF1B5|nr:hypothetical protein [uncultured Paludibaculum sp.]
MNPLTLTEVKALLGQTAGDLKPYQLEQLLDALARRPWPQLDAAAQESLATISSRWSN